MLNNLQATHTRGNCLDFHLSTIELAQRFTHFQVHDSLGSDHFCTTSEFHFPEQPQEARETPRGYDYKIADWDGFKAHACSNLYQVGTLWPPRVPCTEEELDTAVFEITGVIARAKDSAIPAKQARRGSPLPARWLH